MIAKLGRVVLGSVLFLSLAQLASAQTLPSPAQAAQMLQNDPSLLGRLQQMMAQSGMTTDQVRQRLRAAGYPESLLDQYLPGGQADSTALPAEETFTAIRALGIGDSSSVDSLSSIARARRAAKAHADSVFVDSLQLAIQNDTTRSALRSILTSRALQREQADSGFQVFGLDLFKGETAFREANAAGGADPNYRFGPGDRLTLYLTGDVENHYNLTVTPEGFVVIPQVGQINVAGSTRAQLEDQLYSRLGRVYSGVRRSGGTTNFYIDLAQIGRNQIFVNGDVASPGSYRVSRAGTVLTALGLAGGPTANGSMRAVQVKRAGQTIMTLDFYAYALHGDASNDIRLENGDVVFVPPRGAQVRVAGKVIRPATYEITPGQTVADIVQMAGGFIETADRRRIQIERVLPPVERTTAGSDRRVVDVPSDLFATAPVRGGDVIKVLEVSKRVANRVTVLGNVWTPGSIGFVSGMHLSDALRRAGGLKPDSYLGTVQVRRLLADSTRQMLHTALYDTTGRAVVDFELTDNDEISIFPTTAFRPQRYVIVNGAVRRPGRVAFSDGMTLRDAIILAGGTTEGALLTEAEIARLPENRAAGVTAITHVVQMDSGYVLERGANGRYVGPPGLPAPTAEQPEVRLEPYDAVLIKLQPDWQLQQSVDVQGEVKYPGRYTLTSKTERLSDIIRRAGGLSNAAYAEGIVFIRQRNRVGRVGLDLPHVLRDDQFVDNLQVVDGDSIFIPRFTPVVTVRGSVNSAVGVAYVAGADLDYYIRSAGGPNTKGDSKHTYVTQPNGKVETRERHVFGLVRTDPHPQPGSTVFVPDKDPTSRFDWLQVAAGFTSILGSLVAITAILKQ
ncbi:MAG TPA: SLBB domain-containing protein [Gemmatimonadaceae bacterium]